MPYPLPLTRTEAYLAYKAGVIQQSDLKPSLSVPRNGIDAWLAYWTGLASDYPKREDGTPHILQEEEAYIAYLCGVINEYPEKCLRRVGAYLRYLISARWGRPDHPLNREELYLSLIKTQFIPSGDPSSDIVIDGTAKAAFVDVKMYGDTFQQSYTGKNLFPSSVTWTANRAFPTSNQGEWANWAGYYGFLDYIEVEPDTTYAFSNAEGLRFSYGLQYYDSDKNWIDGTNVATTFTTPSNCHYIRGAVSSNTAPTQCQLELSSTTTSYEPFVGGQPSPSPEYPQQIQTVTGEQTVTVVGKNIVDLNNFQSGSYTAATGGWIAYGSRACTVNKIPVKPSSTYVVDNHCTNGYIIRNLVDAYKADGTFIGRLLDNGANGATFTTTADTAFINLTLSETSDTMRWEGYQADFANGTIQPQIELGSSATAYTPYSSTDYPISLGSIELCKLGTYQDYIYKDGDSWKVHKATANITLTTSGWSKSNATANNLYINQYIPNLINNSPLLATNLTVYSSVYIYNNDIVGICYNTTGQGLASIRIGVGLSGASTVTDFKSWLESNPVTLYYALATPTDTNITDTTLIAQLEALKNGGAENGTTYIKVNATDPNLPGLLYVEAPKYE